MKRFLGIIILIVISFQFSFAQSESDDLRREMQQLREQMSKMMEQFGKDFGGNFFFFDTTFVKEFPFDGKRLPFDTSMIQEFRFDSKSFPFDTSFIQEFHWDNFGDGNIRIDTFFRKEFRGLEPEMFPGEFFHEDFSQQLNRMMEQLMQQFGGMDEFYLKEDPQGIEPRKNQPKPEEVPAPKKKRKTTIL